MTIKECLNLGWRPMATLGIISFEVELVGRSCQYYPKDTKTHICACTWVPQNI